VKELCWHAQESALRGQQQALVSFSEIGWRSFQARCFSRASPIGANAMLLSPGSRSSRDPRRGANRLFSVRNIGLAFDALVGGIAFARQMLRRLDERRELTELSALERRDLGPHRVRQELDKWPWQD
jgi:hypothetical protein